MLYHRFNSNIYTINLRSGEVEVKKCHNQRLPSLASNSILCIKGTSETANSLILRVVLSLVAGEKINNANR